TGLVLVEVLRRLEELASGSCAQAAGAENGFQCGPATICEQVGHMERDRTRRRRIAASKSGNNVKRTIAGHLCARRGARELRESDGQRRWLGRRCWLPDRQP